MDDGMRYIALGHLPNDTLTWLAELGPNIHTEKETMDGGLSGESGFKVESGGMLSPKCFLFQFHSILLQSHASSLKSNPHQPLLLSPRLPFNPPTLFHSLIINLISLLAKNPTSLRKHKLIFPDADLTLSSDASHKIFQSKLTLWKQI